MEEGRYAFKILAGTPIGNRPLGRPRSRWEENIKMDVKEMGINTRNWVESAQSRNYWRVLVNAALNIRVPSVSYHQLIADTKVSWSPHKKTVSV